MDNNYYNILGVAPNATDDDIRSAYHRLAREYHPDKATTPEESAQFEEKMSLVSAAYNVLKDVERRERYDKTLSIASNKEEKPKIVSPPSMGAGQKVMNISQQQQHAGTQEAKLNTAKRAFNKGMYLMTHNEPAKAVVFFETAVLNNDKEPLYYARLAQALMKSRESFTRMIEAAHKAIELDPYRSDYYLILAEIYDEANMPSKAKEAYEELLKWDVDNIKAKTRLEELSPTKPVPFWKKLFGLK